jgi:ethanolamine permease
MSDGPRRVLRTLDVWALGVGIVVCGQYFGWNLGLKGNGPAAMLIASLIVCVLFLAWVLTLSELAVAMPTAGGPLEFGRRAGGPWLGFLMAWSLLLSCLFGAVATALASGGYVAFLFDPVAPSPRVAAGASLATIVLFFLLQGQGAAEQSRALVWMTCGAIAALVVFWAVAATNFSWGRVWPDDELLPGNKGWGAVLDAIPFALWWLIIIEGVALAAEETQQPQRSIPRGLTWAMLTVIGMVVLTVAAACGATHYADLAAGPDGKDIDYPLPLVVGRALAGGFPVLLYAFTAVALLGLVASYHGLLYGTSRQAFALGRDGYLPSALGWLHPRRGTPVTALVAVSAVVAGFAVANLWFVESIKLAVLVAGLASLIWYILAMVCLLVLRSREPDLFTRYRAPLPRLLPFVVLALSAVALAVYPRIDANVVPLTAALYAAGGGYYLLFARPRLRPLLAGPADPAGIPIRQPWLERSAGAALALVLIAVGWIVLGASGLVSGVPFDPRSQAIAVLGLLAVALGLLGVVALRHGG